MVASDRWSLATTGLVLQVVSHFLVVAINEENWSAYYEAIFLTLFSHLCLKNYGITPILEKTNLELHRTSCRSVKKFFPRFTPVG